MKFRTISRIIIQTRNKSIKLHSYRAISHFHSTPKSRGSFGIAFDIDGVILRGTNPIGNSPNALKRLYNNHSEKTKILRKRFNLKRFVSHDRMQMPTSVEYCANN
ncbi:hydrolase family protein / HAD-superfamily protein [Artemisia annua]|uniref:Hydrolase family protein / HAD-superfamily protein n=1 Tax=Artemisia annua TaxID=35608 RepID=A0A2U1NKK9_ARTAN|nr:hydrolase family protein / HAD-superfamily protein [Artemisia annua]